MAERPSAPDRERGEDRPGRDLDVFGAIGLVWPLRRHMLAIAGGILAIGWLGILLVVSPRYRADALFLPPSLKDETLPFVSIDMEDQLVAPSAVEKLLGGRQTPALGVVASRDVRLAVVRARDLQTVYGASSEQEAAALLHSRTAVREEESGAIHLAVVDGDARRARDLVQSYLSEIQKRSEAIVRRKVEHMARYLEERAESIDRQLDEALAAWQEHQEKTSVFEVETTARSLSDILSSLISNLARAQAELRALEATHGTEDPVIKSQRKYVAELFDHIQRLKGLQSSREDTPAERAKVVPASARVDRIIPTGSELPGLAAAEQRFRLEIESRARIAGILKSQVEMARLSLIRKEQLMHVLDPPVVPDRPTDRRRKLALTAALLAAFSALGYGYGRVFWERLRRDLPRDPPGGNETAGTTPPRSDDAADER